MNKNKKERKYIVYIHKLKIDGRVYVGQTCLTLNQRSGSNGHRYKYCTKFWNAIKYYGWDAFEHIVIAEDLSSEEANLLEEKLIKEYNSIDEGFNLVPGGRNYKRTEEQKILMSQRMRGEKNPNFGKPRSEETKAKIGQANSIKNLGRKHTEETKNKMKASQAKLVSSVLCVETNIVYSSLLEAARALGKKSGSHIGEACCGKRKTAYGFHWKFVNE